MWTRAARESRSNNRRRPKESSESEGCLISILSVVQPLRKVIKSSVIPNDKCIIMTRENGQKYDHEAQLLMLRHLRQKLCARGNPRAELQRRKGEECCRVDLEMCFVGQLLLCGRRLIGYLSRAADTSLLGVRAAGVLCNVSTNMVRAEADCFSCIVSTSLRQSILGCFVL